SHRPVGYSHVGEVLAGRPIFISGQVAIDFDGNLVGAGDLGAQTEQVFRNLQSALAAVDATFDDVVKFTFFLLDMHQMPVVREVRNRYINIDNPPASTAVEVRRLYRDDVLIEIEAVAVVS
ncbi:MAG: RidA family protein, partial [Caldilineaceae bacterium]|nr:RidA family protein [Caldilineaceae bacterium]